MEILGAIAAKIVEIAMKPIARPVGYLFSYKDNFKELENQVGGLIVAKECIEYNVEAEKKNGRDIKAVVENWLNKGDETLEEAKRLFEDPRRVNAGCSRWHFPNLISRHQLSRNAKKIAQNIADLRGRGKFDQIGYLPQLDITQFISATRDSEKLESRNLMKEDILLALKDPDVSKIGVYGLSGVGKTTLVKEVAEQVKRDKLFDVVVVATISQTLDLDRIQDEIADQLGLRFEEASTVGKASRLFERIRKEKAILVILDDIYEKLDLGKLGIPSQDNYKLGIPLEDNYTGCKLLLTSRNQNILQKNEIQKDFRLEVLNDEESWRLFQIMAGDVVKDVNLNDITIQVAQRCAGLPVLIVTMAKSLKDKDIHHWKVALNELEKADSGEMSKKVFSALKFSYDQLEDDEMRQVFLLCGVLGTSNSVNDLLKYVIGLGIFKHIKTIEDARDKLYKMIDDLKASCLLHDSDARVIMHDIISEIAIKIATRDQYVFIRTWNDRLQDWPSGNFLERLTQIILICCYVQKLPERLDCPNLKFLLLDSGDNPTLEIPNSFFGGMGNLEVLDLTGMIIPSLPTSLASLTKLKTFCLDQCSLQDIVGIGALTNLEILSFIHSSMEEFPNEIGHLTHLRLLDLSNSGIGVIPPNIVSKLTKLEELYMGNALIKWEIQSSTKQNKNASLAELGQLTNLTTLEIQSEAWTFLRDIMFEKLERYKVVVGDKWEWRDNKGSISRLLKLKLDTSTHLEYGIKMLIKRVEDLCLDGINGFSNVLFQLNGEGFPGLKHLHIQNNGEIQHIINSMGRNQTQVLFPKLETLMLQNLSKLEEICHGPLRVDSFGKLRVMKLRNCGQLKYVFLISMVKEFSQLVEIEVSECRSVKNIVFMDSMNSGKVINKVEFIPLRCLTLQYLPALVGFCSDIPTLIFDAKVSLPNLETLRLSSISWNKIWVDNQPSVAKSIQNLTNLIVEDCGCLRYLFSPFMVGNLKNLKRLEISKCHMMEEIIATQGRHTEIALDQDQAGFSKLEEIILSDLKNLKTAWHCEFDGVKTLEVNKCEKLEAIFPSVGDMQKALGSVEILKVCDCGLVEEIFQFTANGMHTHQEVTTPLKKIILWGLPKMKQIWSKDPQGLVHFFNLQFVQIVNCGNLEYVFPFSIAKDLSQLEVLHLTSCGIKEVVSKKNGPMEEITIFELNHLTILCLISLYKLKGFYDGAHTLECQSLKALLVWRCRLLKPFGIQSNRSHESSIDGPLLHFTTLQPLFFVEEVTGNLEHLFLHSVDARMMLQNHDPRHLFHKLNYLGTTTFGDDDGEATFPHSFLKNTPNLKHLDVVDSSVKEIFHDETLTDGEGRHKISTQLKSLELVSLPKLQDLCREGSKIHPVLEVLEVLQVNGCSSLRKLVPSSATFYHLIVLEITKCSGLKSLMTPSTARSLVRLQEMKIEECNSLEEIVPEDVDETKNEIAFNSLLTLELNYLPRLTKFSSSKCSFKFPWLERVVVSQCPRMQIFSPKATSTPKLKKLLIEEKVDGEGYWEGDLTATINNLSLNKVAFRSFTHLEMSKYPELEELWYGQVGHQIFCNLKSLVVQNCNWLSNILLLVNILDALSNLEMLEVRDCDTLEAVFDLTDIDERGIVVRETILLKRITLSNLPKLKQIWKHDSQEIISFGNSGDVHVGECQGSNSSEAPIIENKGEKGDFHSLAHRKLISSNMLRLLHCVEELEVRDCESLEAVFDLKVVVDKEMHVKDASQLKKLTLQGLPNLKHIWNGDLQDILSLKNLQIMTIGECQGLKHLFSVSLCQDLHQLEKLHIEDCGLEEIVAIEGEGLEELEFYFPRLIVFNLILLRQLKSFYPRRHNLECPSLKQLHVYGCDRLQILDFSHLDSRQTLMLDEIDMRIQQALFSLEKVSPSLKWLALNENDCMKILNGHYDANLFPSVETLCLQCFQETPITLLKNFIQGFPIMTTLVVHYSSLKVLFPSEGIGCCSPASLDQTKKLYLVQLEHLRQIWDDDYLSDVLEELDVSNCPSLRCLGPPSISFTSLTFLRVMDCKGLSFLMTASTAKSLVHLKSLMVANCEMMEEVVMIDEGIQEEIIFKSLEYLEITSLSFFKSFCSGKHTLVFPSLIELKVTACLKMMNFSSGDIIVPRQTLVQVENEQRWTEDINTTIKQLVMEKI